MKKSFIIIILTLLVLTFSGCADKVEKLPDTNTYTENGKSMFVEIEHTRYWQIVYNKKTKVMYAISSEGQFTLLVKPDGSPMTYEEG